MGDSRLTDNAGNDDVELEVMCKDSFSWHPCLVSLRSTGLGLIVKYVDINFEEIIADKKGVLARIRVRSSPLQGDDCSSIQQGDQVLATKNKGIFYDGRVEQAIQVRHSKRTHCRCSFTVKWLHQALEGEEMILPANSIMKLSSKNINLHPTISAFFSMEEASAVIDALPFSTTVDGMDWERDISVLLEKQIKEISHSIDVPDVPQKILLGLEVDVTRQNHDKATDASYKDLYIITPSVSNLKGSTQSQNKHSVVTTMEKEKFPAHITSIQEELAGSRLPLNPLAARAALASLRSKLPQNAELSSMSCEFSLKMSTTLEGKNPQYEGIVKTLFPNPNAFQITQLSNEPSKAQTKGAGKKNKNSEKKITHPSETTRVSCRQTQRTSKMQESAQMTDIEGEELRSSSKTRRVTRSIVNGTGIIELEESKKTIDENMSTKLAKLASDAQCFTYPRNCLSDNKKAIASPTDIKMNAPAEVGKSFFGKDGIVVAVDPGPGIFVEEAEKLHPSKRVTRSAAREGSEKKKNFLPEPKLRKRKSCESSESKLEDNGILKTNSSELEQSIIPPGAAKIGAQSTKEREETTPDISVGCSSKGSKKKSTANSKTRETRSSSRLSSFRRTRSQTGA